VPSQAIPSFLDVARWAPTEASRDRKAKSNGQIPRRAILATLVFAGLRIGELIDLYPASSRPRWSWQTKRLLEAGETPLPVELTPHKLRHTYASLLVALGVDPGAVMDQLGHTESSFTIRVYRHGMRRDHASKEHLQRFVLAAEWAAMGSSAHFEGQMEVGESDGAAPKGVPEQGISAKHPAKRALATSFSGGERSIH
jgi:hypothetical protein